MVDIHHLVCRYISKYISVITTENSDALAHSTTETSKLTFSAEYCIEKFLSLFL